jgi:hypothetical protein
MHEETTMSEAADETTVSRRGLLRWLAGGLGAVVVAGVVGVELVDHGVLPGKLLLDELDGACSVTAPKIDFGEVGTTASGRFYSKHVVNRWATPLATGPDISRVTDCHSLSCCTVTAKITATPSST